MLLDGPLPATYGQDSARSSVVVAVDSEWCGFLLNPSTFLEARAVVSVPDP